MQQNGAIDPKNLVNYIKSVAPNEPHQLTTGSSALIYLYNQSAATDIAAVLLADHVRNNLAILKQRDRMPCMLASPLSITTPALSLMHWSVTQWRRTQARVLLPYSSCAEGCRLPESNSAAGLDHDSH